MTALVTIRSDLDRAALCRAIQAADRGTRVELRGPVRSLPQNDRLWASLTDVARQVEWRDLLGRPRRLTPEQWKLFFLDMLNEESVLVPRADGVGVVNIGRSSSKLSKVEFSGLLDLIYAFGAERGVKFHDGQEPSGAQEPCSEAA